jgi:hypothetical protein
MAYRQVIRDQMQLLPPCIEEYVTPDDPVRAYNAFVAVVGQEPCAPDTVCADAGYSDIQELKKIDDQSAGSKFG